MAYFPLRKKGASIAATDQADYKIVQDTSLSSAQKTALANGTGVTISGSVYTLAQPLPAGAVGFASEQGAADYLLQQTPGLGGAKWFSKYSGPLWERLIAGVAVIGALGAGDGAEDDGTTDGTTDDGKPDDSKPDDSEDNSKSDDTSKGAAVAAGLAGVSLAGFLGALTNIDLWMRIAKVVGGGAILIVGLVKLTGADKSLGGVAKTAVKVAPFL